MSDNLQFDDLFIEIIKGLFTKHPDKEFDVEELYQNVKMLYNKKEWILPVMHLLLVRNVVVPTSKENDSHQKWKLKKGYQDKSWSERHPTKEKMIIASLSAIFSLLIGFLLLQYKDRSQSLIDSKQDSTISHEKLRLDNLQTYLKDSLCTCKKDSAKIAR